jgi:TonB family protein
VLMELQVDESGHVAAARVIEGAGDPFDAAALEAAKKFTFEPAILSTGDPVPVTINFRMRITAPTPVEPGGSQPSSQFEGAPAPETPPAPVFYTGTLLERGTRKPIAGTEVQAILAGEALASTATDDSGRFSLKIPAARFTLVAIPPGHDKLAAEIEAQPGE